MPQLGEYTGVYTVTISSLQNDIKSYGGNTPVQNAMIMHTSITMIARYLWVKRDFHDNRGTIGMGSYIQYNAKMCLKIKAHTNPFCTESIIIITI